MADRSGIEWTDATWNPIVGCSVISPGCTNCYAMKLAGGRMQNHPSRQGLTKPSKAGPVWNGVVRFMDDWLDQPIRWKRPRKIFVCAHSDLFHEAVPDEWIDKVFAVMAMARWHVFQVLTKRPERMKSYYDQDPWPRISRLASTLPMANTSPPGTTQHGVRYLHQHTRLDDHFHGHMWPLPNVHLGVSAEDQPRADERIPLLLRTPAAVRWVSAEPLLGPIHLGYLGWPTGDARPRDGHNALIGARYEGGKMVETLPKLDWVVVGGESGKDARPMHPDWARGLRDQCEAAGVPFFMKQMSGERKSAMPPIPEDLMIREAPRAAS